VLLPAHLSGRFEGHSQRLGMMRGRKGSRGGEDSKSFYCHRLPGLEEEGGKSAV